MASLLLHARSARLLRLRDHGTRATRTYNLSLSLHDDWRAPSSRVAAWTASGCCCGSLAATARGFSNVQLSYVIPYDGKLREMRIAFMEVLLAGTPLAASAAILASNPVSANEALSTTLYSVIYGLIMRMHFIGAALDRC